MRIGAGFFNANDNGTYISVAFDDEFKALNPVFKECKMILKELLPEERTKENSPHYRVELYIPKDKNS